MKKDKSTLKKLKDELIKSGLSITQARIFLFLVVHRSDTIKNMSEILKIPRTPLYLLLMKLRKKRIVSSISSHPMIWFPVSTDKAVARLNEKPKKISLQEEMASKVNKWLEDLGYPYATLENDYTVLDVDAKVSLYTFNICVPSGKEFYSVHIESKLELSSDEKKKLDKMEENIREQFLRSIKRICLVNAGNMKFIYGMKWSDFSGVDFTHIIEYDELNKKRFLKTLSNMVKVLDLVNRELTNYAVRT